MDSIAGTVYCQIISLQSILQHTYVDVALEPTVVCTLSIVFYHLYSNHNVCITLSPTYYRSH